MKRYQLFFLVTVSVCALSVTLPGCSTIAQNKKTTNKPMYTAYNIWKYDDPRLMYCINFKSAPEFIPAGTEITDAKYEPGDRHYLSKIKFRLKDTNEKITITMSTIWQPGKAPEDFLERMFTAQSFEQLTNGLSAAEVNAIKKGAVINGMRKRAVRMSYGYPPGNRTKSLDASDWFYWMSPMEKKLIRFDINGRVIEMIDKP